MTNSTTTTIAGTNLVTAAREEFIAFAMDKVSGFTVARLENELTALNVPFRKKDIKEVKAGLLYDALRVDEDATPAAGETPVAEQNLEEETTMTLIEKVAHIKATREAIKEHQGRARINIQQFREEEGMRAGHGENPNLLEMLAKVNAAKDRYFSRVGEHAITLETVTFYPEKGEASRAEISNKQFARVNKLPSGTDMHIIGEVVVRLPEKFAQIKRWDKNKVNSKGTLGAPVFVDFDGYDATFTKGKYNMRAPLADGSNLIALNIIEFISKDGVSGGLDVSLPREKGKDGRYWPLFKTNDIRMVKTTNAETFDEPLYTEDNNEQFNAMVTAMVRLYAAELVTANPENHFGFDKTWCVNMVRFSVKDGVNDDLDMASTKSRVILEQPDTMQSSTVGPEQPQRYCTVKHEWIDMEAVHILNKADKAERTYGLDEKTREERFQRHDEIIWNGTLVEKNTVRDAITAKECSTCPFFCGNTPRDEKKVNAEKVEAREKGASDYVNSFYREKAKASAQAIQVLVGTEEKAQDWVLAVPGQLEDGVIHSIRVASGGMNLYASQEVLENMDLEYVPPVEEFDAVAADFNKKIDWIYSASFRKDELSEDQMARVEALEKPEGLTEWQSRRWDTAIGWFEKSKQWEVERAAASEVKPFYQHFFTGEVASRRVYFEHFTLAEKVPFITRPASMVELHVDDIMAERLEKASHSDFDSMEDLMDISGDDSGEYNARRNDYIHSVYDDFTNGEFARYLDDNARNFVDDVIEQGTYYTIVGGSQRDKELAAGAMQELLQREVQWSWVRGIRRDDNPLVALLEAKVSEEVKAYIVEVLGLLN